ncbi:hypothetical protein UCDDA912_g07058 [Diaporthe ampelina]|uniref:MYND-type domain-containing protein n=1 Tax=Diaporthe ampelina TaxID=1214573 RepID=A0A0G2FEL9_9PEZI|nr:hypothetical protein UCDDA912_g07058 [Diaporthe ampelina]
MRSPQSQASGHDDAIGHAIKIIKDITQGNDRHFAHMMDRLLVDSPLGVLGYYAEEFSLTEKIEGEVDESIYLPIVFGAMMMEYGATIKEDHIEHLRDLVPKIQCNEGMTAPLIEYVFRGPGKRQFLAALDSYQADKPRSLHQPSCHGCEKVGSDIEVDGKALRKCGGCKNEIAAASFCDKDCQRDLWKHHKRNCGPPRGRGVATFKSFGKASLGFIVYEGANM